MGYSAIQNSFRKGFPQPRQGSATTAMLNPTLDKKDIPQFMDPSKALKVINYIVTSDQGLAKRKGLSELFEVVGNNPINLLAKFTDDIYFFATQNNLKAYIKSSGTVELVRTMSTSADIISGQRYGDYFFVTNGAEKIGRVSRTLNYDAQAVNFTVGAKLTGGTSLATAIILQDADAGVTGTLTLGNIVGTFQDNELITDSAGGSATANGVVTWTYNTITQAPICRVLKVVGPRLYAGNLSTDSSAVAYSNTDTGTNPPFNSWTVGANAADPGLVNYRNAGAVNAIDSLGANIIVLSEDGKWAFTTTVISNNNLLQKTDQTVQDRIDMGGSRASLSTPKGMFYVNEGGLWQLMSIGQANVPFSEQEMTPSLLLGIDFFKDANLDNADLVFDSQTNNLYLTMGKGSSTNNLVIAYNTVSGVFSLIQGWNINRFMTDGDIIYGAGSSQTKVWQCFEGYDDDGQDIWTEYEQEIKTGDLYTRQILLGEYVQGYLSPSTLLNVVFDIYDVKGHLVSDKIILEWTADGDASQGSGWGQQPWGSGFGGDSLPFNDAVESFAGARAYIRNYQRIRVNISGHDKLPHNLTWINILSRVKIAIRRRNLNLVTS